MIPTIVFPNLGNLYPNHSIIAVNATNDSLTRLAYLPLISQIRSLKEADIDEFVLQLQNQKTKAIFEITCTLSDLDFCRPARRFKRRFSSVFFL